MKLPRIITKLAAVCIAALAFTSCVTKQEAERNRQDKAREAAMQASSMASMMATYRGLSPEQANAAANKAWSEAYANAMKAPLDMDAINDNNPGAIHTAAFLGGVAAHAGQQPAAPVCPPTHKN